MKRLDFYFKFHVKYKFGIMYGIIGTHHVSVIILTINFTHVTAYLHVVIKPEFGVYVRLRTSTYCGIAWQGHGLLIYHNIAKRE